APARVVLFFGAAHELDPRRWIDRYTWRRVDAGVAVAHAAVRWYADAGFGPREKLHVLWKGVDLAAFDAAQATAAATRAALGVGPADLAVATVGRMAWQKGLGDLFAAIAALRPPLPQARFFVIGGGRDAAATQEAAAGLGDTVRFLGHRDDVPALL